MTVQLHDIFEAIMATLWITFNINSHSRTEGSIVVINTNTIISSRPSKVLRGNYTALSLNLSFLPTIMTSFNTDPDQCSGYLLYIIHRFYKPLTIYTSIYLNRYFGHPSDRIHSVSEFAYPFVFMYYKVSSV